MPKHHHLTPDDWIRSLSPRPNLLARTRCYLIGPMENVSSAEGRGWRNSVKTQLSAINVTVFDPFLKPFDGSAEEDEQARTELTDWMVKGQYDRVSDRMRRVRSDDLRLCDISDFFVVFIEPKIASYGTAEELVTANRMKKPIFVVVNGGKTKTPLWVMGMIPHHYLYDSVQDALNMIKLIDSGEKVIDSDRWRLLRKELR